MHLNMIQGDFIFHYWKDNAWRDFRRKENELRKQGFRKVNQEFEFQELYMTYKRKKKRVTLTMALC